MFTIERIELLLLIAALVAMVARRLRLPYTVGLVVAGTSLAALGIQTGVELTKELIFNLFLPPLVFEAALFIEWKRLRLDLVPALVLATGGVTLATGLTAAGMHYLAGWIWPTALLFGALISATDPVSVIAVFKESKVEGRLRLLVEAESLLNDGVAAVIFGVLVAWVSGHQLTAATVGVDLLREVGGGVAFGLATGGAVLFLAGRTTDHLVEITFTTLAAFGSFWLAQHFHCSGVLATLVCGLMLGNIGTLGAFTDKGREAVHAFWEYAAFVVNSLIFLLIGVSEQALFNHFGTLAVPLIIAIVVVTLSRGVVVYPLAALFNKSRRPIETKHVHILFWGGLRGALALALALGLPADLPNRTEIITVAFGVVAFSVIVQGVSMPWLLNKLGLIQKPGTREPELEGNNGV
ncbi:MAG: sodium:proton antiporter [Fimbriimonadaceae bacterium]|nr:sodium:proton antiporter [Fimbriimonadaceae bacterium]